MSVKTERHGGVLVVQLDRDEKRNAINGEMTESISAALDAGEDDPAVRAIVIAGGPTVFCAGTDIAEGSGTPTDRGGEYGIIRRRSTTPIIAAVEGAEHDPRERRSRGRARRVRRAPTARVAGAMMLRRR